MVRKASHQNYLLCQHEYVRTGNFRYNCIKCNKKIFLNEDSICNKCINKCKKNIKNNITEEGQTVCGKYSVTEEENIEQN